MLKYHMFIFGGKTSSTVICFSVFIYLTFAIFETLVYLNKLKKHIFYSIYIVYIVISNHNKLDII